MKVGDKVKVTFTATVIQENVDSYLIDLRLKDGIGNAVPPMQITKAEIKKYNMFKE